MASSWGDVGSQYNWDALSNLEIGKECNVVIQMACYEPCIGAALGVIFPNNCNVRVKGLIDIRESTQTITLIDVLYEGVSRIPSFKVTPSTLIVQHSPVRVASLYNVVELCAGIGIATTGLEFVGLQTKLAVELRAPFASTFAHLHPDAQVITGDITSPQCLKNIARSAPGSCMLVAGFNCQPYSRAGAMKGINDVRAESLHGVLQVAFYLRSPIVVLECVVEASTNRHVQEELASFCSRCGYHKSDMVLRFEDVWPCRRERWWVVLSAYALGFINLKPLPIQPFPNMVKQVLPRPLKITEHDLEQLRISGEELQRFLQFRPDLKGMMVALQGKCPTLLHSLGAQVTECLCGCRTQGFGDATLAKGLFGIIMPIARPDYNVESMDPQVRHPHPNEVALLSAIIPQKNWGCHHRLALAGIGQQANPIHALWIGAHIIAHLEFIIEGQVSCSPRAVLDDYIEEVLQWCRNAPLVPNIAATPSSSAQSQELAIGSTGIEQDIAMDEAEVPVPSEVVVPASPGLLGVHNGDHSSCTLVSVASGSHIVLAVDQQTTVGHLISAEASLQGPGTLVEVLDPTSHDKVAEDVLLYGKCFWIRHFVVPLEVPNADGGLGVVPAHDPISPTIPFTVSENQVEEKHAGHESSPNDPAEVRATDIHQFAPDLRSGSVATDPLVSLTTKQLTELSLPVVTNPRCVDALLAQTISNQDRLAILETQGELWADDEMRWHLWQSMDRTHKQGVVMLDPLIATAATKVPSPGLLENWFASVAFTPKIIITAICIDAHWTPLVWTWNEECLTANSWDLPGLFPSIRHLNDCLAKTVGARTFTHRLLHRMDGLPFGCGVCAARYIEHFLAGRMLPTTREDIEYLSKRGKELFTNHARHAIHLSRPWCWGNGLEAQAQQRLADLLKQHGVPDDAISARSHLVLQAIGVGPLQKCLVGSSPWRSLKALANQCQPTLQLVLPNELQEVLANKQQPSNQRRKAKGQAPVAKHVPQKPPPLDPTKMTFDTGAFVTEAGSPLPAIPVSQLGPLAEGVALASLSDVEPFLRSGQTVSQNSLAVFLVNVDEAQLSTKLSWAQARVALRCMANGEPMLLNGYLVQMGKKMVVQARTANVVEVQSLPAACLKIAIYRDGVTCSWEDVINAPIRYLLQCLEPMATCSQPADSCKCSKWHINGDTGVRDPIFDLWRRQWLSLSMRVANPSQADLFMVNVRYAKAIELPVLKLSGINGIFLEPRSLDAREQVPDFQVLWMARQSLADLTHIKQCNPGVIGVARLGARLGLRIHTADMSTLGQTLKPDAILLGGGPRMDFELGPVPFGLDRAGIARLCKQWGWIAKPINPTKSVSALGAVWHMQSCVEPPTTVVSVKGGVDVVITKVTPKVVQPQSAQPAVASAETIGLCAMNSGEVKPVDPWVLKDPWGYVAPTVGVSQPVPFDLEASLQQVEQRVERAVLAKIPSKASVAEADQDMEVGNGETRTRLQVLEEQVSRLASGQQQLEHRIEETGKKSDAQICQLQHQMSAQLEVQGTRIEEMFRGQMTQIESLLTKKARHE